MTDRAGAHFGFAVSLWLGGVFVVPQYTHVFTTGRPDLDEICLGCTYSKDGFASLNFDD